VRRIIGLGQKRVKPNAQGEKAWKITALDTNGKKNFLSISQKAAVDQRKDF
jgi:hypothetical protein